MAIRKEIVRSPNELWKYEKTVISGPTLTREEANELFDALKRFDLKNSEKVVTDRLDRVRQEALAVFEARGLPSTDSTTLHSAYDVFSAVSHLAYALAENKDSWTTAARALRLLIPYNQTLTETQGIANLAVKGNAHASGFRVQ
jgi:hypothetical protein